MGMLRGNFELLVQEDSNENVFWLPARLVLMFSPIKQELHKVKIKTTQGGNFKLWYLSIYY